MTPLKYIYTPRGKANEYADLAVNLFTGCDHACTFCYVPKLLHKTSTEFHSSVTPRKNILKMIEHDAAILESQKDEREILLCFTCDIYSAGAIESSITSDALRILLEHGLNINILTKGGSRSLQDYDLLKQYKDQVRYGISLVFSDDADSRKYESGAVVTSDRINTLYTFKCAGIKTWVSLEPIWSAKDACELIDQTWLFADEYKIGKLNYHPHAKTVDWRDTIQAIAKHCELNKVDYMLKKDTAKLVI